MIGNVSLGFADLITIREILEEGIKNDKITNTTESSGGARKSSGNFQKKKGAKVMLFQMK